MILVRDVVDIDLDALVQQFASVLKVSEHFF
jgi:hypothetical protein